MIRQILNCLLVLIGILLTFFFWFHVLHLETKFLQWNRDPETFLWGLGLWALLGAVVCLFLSRHIANWTMKAELLPLDQQDPLVDQIARVLDSTARKLGIQNIPQLGIYDRQEINAYIIGFSTKHSTLVVSRGLLQQATTAEWDMVITRELLHFKSGDLVALAFMQGAIFAFTLYVARMLAFLLGTSMRQSEEEATSSDGVEVVLTMALVLLLTLPSTIVFWLFSRTSSLRADTATANQVGAKAYAEFLTKLPGPNPLRREIFSDAFKLQNRPYAGWLSWQSLQPSLPLRIKRLSF